MTDESVKGAEEGPQQLKRLEQVYIEQSVWCGLERAACVKGCLPSIGHLQGHLTGMGEMAVVENMVRISRNMNSLLKWTLDGADGGIGIWICLNDAEDEGLLGLYSLSTTMYPQFILKVERQLVSRVGDDLDPYISITAWSWPDQRPLSIHLLDQPCIPPPWFTSNRTSDFFIQEYFQLLGRDGRDQGPQKHVRMDGEMQRLAMLKTCLRIQLQTRIQHLEEVWRERKRMDGEERIEVQEDPVVATDENHFYHLLHVMASRDLPLVHSDWLRKRPLQPSLEKPSIALRSLRLPAAEPSSKLGKAPAPSTSQSMVGGKRERRSKAIIANGTLITSNVNAKPRPILPLLPSPSPSSNNQTNNAVEGGNNVNSDIVD